MRVNWVAIILGGYFAWCGVLYVLQDSIFFPGRSLSGPTPSPPSGVASRWVKHPDGSRTEYWITEGESAGPFVVFLHGNGHRIENEEPIIEFLQRRGYGVVLPEYRGYGSSEGEPSERAIVRDLTRIVDELEAGGVRRDRIAYWGRSIGASFAALLAVERPPRGLVLQTPLARADHFAHSFGAPAFLVKHPLRVDRALRGSTVPTQLIQHTRDDVVSPKDAERLLEIRPDAEVVRIDAAHNDSGSSAEQAKEDAAITAFLSRLWAP